MLCTDGMSMTGSAQVCMDCPTLADIASDIERQRRKGGR